MYIYINIYIYIYISQLYRVPISLVKAPCPRERANPVPTCPAPSDSRLPYEGGTHRRLRTKKNSYREEGAWEDKLSGRRIGSFLLEDRRAEAALKGAQFPRRRYSELHK